MEWGRSAYQSRWHLFRDSSITTTAGRYYFARPGTPHVPGAHNLGSRNWHDGNWKHAVQLGEDIEWPQEWDPGFPPPLLPLNQQIGNANCLEFGESLSEALPDDRIDNGFNDQCFAPCSSRQEDVQVATGFNTCQMQKFYARVINLMYLNDGATIGTMFYQLLGPRVVVTFHDEQGLMPAVTTVISNTITIIVIDGTRTFQQFVMQAFSSISTPTPQGPYSTVPLWWQASQWAHDFAMADGQVPGTPCLIVGHSYGGCAALCLAARYRFWHATRNIRYLTYGAPKAGDVRLFNLLNRCEGINILNDDDLAGVFPPDYVTLLPVMLFMGHPEFVVWADWLRMPNQTTMDTNGVQTLNDPPPLDFTTLLTAAIQALAHVNVNVGAGHSITEYIRRLTLRCPVDSWPFLDPCTPIISPATGGIGWSYSLPVMPALALGGEMPAAGGDVLGHIIPPAFGGIDLGGELAESAEVLGGDLADGAEVLGGDLAADGAEVLGGDLAADGAEVLVSNVPVFPIEPVAGAEVLGGELAESAEVLGGELAESSAEVLGGELAESSAIILDFPWPNGPPVPVPGAEVLGGDVGTSAEVLGGELAATSAEVLGGELADGAEVLGGDVPEFPIDPVPGAIVLGGGELAESAEVLGGDVPATSAEVLGGDVPAIPIDPIDGPFVLGGELAESAEVLGGELANGAEVLGGELPEPEPGNAGGIVFGGGGGGGGETCETADDMMLGVPEVISVPIDETRWFIITDTLPPPIANYTISVSGMPGGEPGVSVSIQQGNCDELLGLGATDHDQSFGFITHVTNPNIMRIKVTNIAGAGVLNVTVLITQP